MMYPLAPCCRNRRLWAEENPRSVTQITLPSTHSRMSALTCRINAESAVFPGQHPDPDRDPVPSDGHPDDDLGKVVAAVLGLAVRPESRRLIRVRIRVRVLAAGLLAAPVPRGLLVGVLQLEVRAGGVEEQQVHFDVQQVRGR